jgi:uncharacterized protein YgfB (UPF0149 family)
LAVATGNPSEFQAVEQMLQQASSLVGAAESHGMLWGMSCSGTAPSFELWMAQVLADVQLSPSVREQCNLLLASTYQETLSQLHSPNLEFQPLLLGDDCGLGLRVQALGEWCEGFLYGLGLGSATDPLEWSADVQEILRDIGEISKLQFDNEGPIEDAENDYMEVLEYVRMAVLLMSEELRLKASPAQLQ